MTSNISEIRFGTYINGMNELAISRNYKKENIHNFIERISYKNTKEQTYEYIEGVPFKFCVDYDAKNQELTPENIEVHKRKCLTKLMTDLGSAYDVKESDIKISSNHRNGKISFHFVIPHIQTTKETIRAYAKESGIFDASCQYGIFRCPLSYKVPANANDSKEEHQKPRIEHGNPIDFVLQDLSNIKRYFFWQESEEEHQENKKEQKKEPKKSAKNARLESIRRGLFDCLGNMVDEYDDWLNVMWCLQGMAARDEFNKEKYFELFDEWSKQSKNYNIKGNLKCWLEAEKNAKKSKNQYGYNKFRELCIEQNEEAASKIFGNSYEEIKRIFEEENVMIKDTVCYVCYSNNEIKIYNRKDFVCRYEDLSYMKINKHGEEEKCQFIDQWLKDDTKRWVDKIDFLPRGCKNDFTGKIFNTFDGFRVDKLPMTKESKKVDMGQFMDYIGDLVGDKEENIDFTLKFLAHIIKYPGRHHRVAIAIKSEQGQGKGTLYYMMRNLLGHKYCNISAGSDNYTGGFNSSLMNKLFVCIDEQTGQKAYSAMETLKSITGNETLTINEKFKNAIEIRNFVRFMIFTNGDNPVVIEKDNTRYAVFESSGRNRNNAQFFTNLRNKYIYDPDGIIALYEYLLNYPVSEDYDFSNNIPKTDIYTQMKSANRPAIENFFINLYYEYNKKQCKIIDDEEEFIAETLEEQQEKAHKDFKYYSNTLYKNFRDYCSQYGFKYESNIQAFGRLLKKYCWIKTDRDMKGIYYIILPYNIEKELINN